MERRERHEHGPWDSEKEKKRKEKNEAAGLRRAETRKKIGEGTKGREKKLKRER